MKRSEINRALAWAEGLLASKQIRLPRYAYWDMDKWAENKEQIEEIRRAALGWGIVEFAPGSFGESGAVLYTLRNGGPGAAPCRESYILMREGQFLPIHRHPSAWTELVNRTGGVLALRLWNTDDSGAPLESDVRVRMDGIACGFRAGEPVRVYPGDSVSLPPHVARSFGPEPGYGDLIASALAPVDGCPLLPALEIEEDEAVLHPLRDEYAKLI